MNFSIFYIVSKPLRLGLTLTVSIIILSTLAYAQSEPTVYSNDVVKQRLLIHITANYIHTYSQGQIDRDSAMLIPCKAYGLSALLPYNEGYSNGKPSAGTRLLDAGKVKEASALLAKLQGEDRLRLLIELGTYLVFKPGAAKAHLDEASQYVKEAVVLSETHPHPWKIESLTLQGFLLHQSGLAEESQEIFAQIVTLCEHEKNDKALAQALLSAGKLLPYGQPTRLANFQRAYTIFQKLQAKDKVVEAVSELTIEHFILRHYAEAERYLQETLELLTALKIYHQQYTYDALSYVAWGHGNMSEAIALNNKSFEYVKSRTDSLFLPIFLTRRGGLYENVDKYNEALDSYNLALQNVTHDTRLYWYKAFLMKARVLNNNFNRHQEALSFMKDIEKRFPPATIFEKMYSTLMFGESYEGLDKFDLAEHHYKAFLVMAEDFPVEYIHGEFPDAYSSISVFYRIIGKTAIARELLNKVKKQAFANGTVARGSHYWYLFKIDSTEKRYLDAIRDLQLNAAFMDSITGVEQKKRVDELLVKYEAEKKDKDIQLLKQQAELQQATLQQSQFAQRITIVGAALLLLIAGLLYYLYRTKQKSNTQLRSLVNEKEWLLKEVHHRVKNNLQTVLSLLESQSRQLSNEALHAIQESQNRVYAMSLIHKKLYQSTDVASIDMEDYLRDLVQHLRESFGQSGAIRFSLQFDPVNLDVSQAVPIGLIVNEAITNAIKYAFPERNDDSEIFVSLTTANDKIELVISDNGVGMSIAKTGNTQSLGLKLMRGLTEDIDGFFTIDTESGVTIHVQFVPSVPLHNTIAALSSNEPQSA